MKHNELSQAMLGWCEQRSYSLRVSAITLENSSKFSKLIWTLEHFWFIQCVTRMIVADKKCGQVFSGTDYYQYGHPYGIQLKKYVRKANWGRLQGRPEMKAAGHGHPVGGLWDDTWHLKLAQNICFTRHFLLHNWVPGYKGPYVDG